MRCSNTMIFSVTRTEIVEPGRIAVDDPENAYRYEVSGNCPVHSVGKVLDRDLYFRARGDLWSFEVADHKGAFPSDGQSASDGFYREGEYSNAGLMSNHEAVKIIDRCLKEYLGLKC